MPVLSIGVLSSTSLGLSSPPNGPSIFTILGDIFIRFLLVADPTLLNRDRLYRGTLE
jgi:hypothetical protein